MPVPWNLIAGALTAGVAFARGIRADREAERARQAALAASGVAGNTEDDVAASARQYVVGKFATTGVPLPSIDSGVRTRNRNQRTGRGGVIRWREVHSLSILSAGPLASVDEIWIDDMIAPITPDTGQSPPVRVWGTNGWTLQKRVKFYRYYDLLGAGNLRARFEDLRARMDALVPGWRPTMEGEPLVIPNTLDAVTVSLFDDLLAEYNALLLSASFIDWKDRRYVVAGNTKVPVNEPAVFVRLSLGEDSDQLPASPLQAFARINVPGWKSSDIGKGMSFALNTFRFWFNDGDESQRIRPWGRIPSMRYVATGGGDFDGNAAKLARWILLQSDRELSDMEGLDAAIARCGALVEIPDMTYRTTSPVSPAVLEWADFRKYLWPDESYPPEAEERRVLAEINKRVAGPGNARMRYGINSVITSEQVNSGEALRICEERMGGSIVELAGKKVAFRPASPRSSVFSSTRETRVESLNWRMVDQDADPHNALVATIRQDEDRLYRSSVTPRSELTALVERDGLAVRKREAKGITRVIDAMRQNAFLLDVNSIGKRAVEFAELTESATDPKGLAEPGDIVALEMEGVSTLVRISQVQPRQGRTIYIGREIDSDWADDKFFPTPINRDPPPGGGGDLDLSSLLDLRFRRTADGRVADIAFNPGRDVVQYDIEAIWRERVASEPAVPDVVQHYLLNVDADQRGEWFVHTIVEQENDPPVVVASDAEPEIFEGDMNRELALSVFALNGGARGSDLGRIIVPPSSVGGSPVQYKAVIEEEIMEGTIFVGWKVQIQGIEVSGGELVYTWGGIDETAYTLPSADLDDNIHLKNLGTTEDPNWVLEITNTYRLSSGQSTITLAARTGSGTTQDPHAYSAGNAVDVNKYVKPQDLSYQVESPPTTAGGFEGQQAFTVEDSN